MSGKPPKHYVPTFKSPKADALWAKAEKSLEREDYEAAERQREHSRRVREEEAKKKSRRIAKKGIAAGTRRKTRKTKLRK